MTLARELRQHAAGIWHIQRIKRLVRAQLAMDAVVSVREVTCADPVCPGPAVQVTILGFDLVRRQLVLHKPAADVAEVDVVAAFSSTA